MKNFHIDFLKSCSSELSGRITKAWPKPVDLGVVGKPERWHGITGLSVWFPSDISDKYQLFCCKISQKRNCFSWARMCRGSLSLALGQDGNEAAIARSGFPKWVSIQENPSMSRAGNTVEELLCCMQGDACCDIVALIAVSEPQTALSHSLTVFAFPHLGIQHK